MSYHATTPQTHAETQTSNTKRGPYGATEHQWVLMERAA